MDAATTHTQDEIIAELEAEVERLRMQVAGLLEALKMACYQPPEEPRPQVCRG